MDSLLEFLAERSHIGWMQEKQAQGFADHVFDPGAPDCCYRAPTAHHTDMKPYADLPENVKQYDRKTVQGVLDGIAAAGYRLVKAD